MTRIDSFLLFLTIFQWAKCIGESDLLLLERNTICDEDTSLQEKLECGYYGISESQCVALSCCWKPLAPEISGPWCYHTTHQEAFKCSLLPQSASPSLISFPSFPPLEKNAIYSTEETQTIFKYFMKNFYGNGGILASPDDSTFGGSYRYHWSRDAGLTMSSFLYMVEENSALRDFDLILSADNRAEIKEEKKKFDEIKEKGEERIKRIEKIFDLWINFEYAAMGKTNANEDRVSIHGHHIFIEPKFEFETAYVLRADWCRPQTDSASVRTKAIIEYLNFLMKNKKWKTFYRLFYYNMTQEHIKYIATQYTKRSCDLWEEVYGDTIFFNLLSYKNAASLSIDLIKKMLETLRYDVRELVRKMRGRGEERGEEEKGGEESGGERGGERGDEEREANGEGMLLDSLLLQDKEGEKLVEKSRGSLMAVRLLVEREIERLEDLMKDLKEGEKGMERLIKERHIKNNSYIEIPEIRERDGAIIIALVDFNSRDGFTSPLSPTSTRSVRTLAQMFCGLYEINQKNSNQLLIGRYFDDIYGGGNPWVLHTAALAEFLYMSAEEILMQKENPEASVLDDYSFLMKLSLYQNNKMHQNYLYSAELLIRSADQIMKNIKNLSLPDDLHLAEQIDRTSGHMIGASDLTWSYANVLKALTRREKSLELLRNAHP